LDLYLFIYLVNITQSRLQQHFNLYIQKSFTNLHYIKWKYVFKRQTALSTSGQLNSTLKLLNKRLFFN